MFRLKACALACCSVSAGAGAAAGSSASPSQEQEEEEAHPSCKLPFFSPPSAATDSLLLMLGGSHPPVQASSCMCGMRHSLLKCKPRSAWPDRSLTGCSCRALSLRVACVQVLPQVQQPRTGINEGVKVGVLGIGALILLGAAFYVGRKLLSSQLPKVQKVPSLQSLLQTAPNTPAAQRLSRISCSTQTCPP